MKNMPLARQFLSVFLVVTALPLFAQAADVRFCGVIKGQVFSQSGPGPAAAESPRYVFQAFIESGGPLTLTNAVLRLPNLSEVALTTDSGYGWNLEAGFNSATELNAAYPDGTYQFITEAVNDGRWTNSMLLTTTYPATPHFSDYEGAQAVDPTTAFLLEWDPLTGGSATDFVQMEVMDCTDRGLFSSPEPGAVGALNTFSNSVVIPARTLRPGQVFQCQLLVAKVSTYNTNSYPGARTIAGALKMLSMPITTVGDPMGCPVGRLGLTFSFPDGTFQETQGVIPVPTGLSNYWANFEWGDAPSAPSQVTFSGPPGSGLSNTPNISGGPSGGWAWYSSPSMPVPPFPPGGIYTVGYDGTNQTYNLLDPEAVNQQVLIVPHMVTNASGAVEVIEWTYRDASGVVIPMPSFLSYLSISLSGWTNQLFQAGIDGEELSTSTTNLVLSPPIPWRDVIHVSTMFQDIAGNSYHSHWSHLPAPLAITTASLADGSIGFPYSQSLTASGGTLPYQWCLQNGGLPPGIMLDEATGALSGTPLTNGISYFTVCLSDFRGQMAWASLSITVQNYGPNPPTISPIPDQVVRRGETAPASPFTLGDVDTALPSLSVWATASDSNVVSEIVLGGTGTNWSVSVVLVPATLGQSTITVFVSDGPHTASESFEVIVAPPTDVIDYLLAKGEHFLQTNAAAPVRDLREPFAFRAEVVPVWTGFVHSASVKILGGGLKSLEWDGNNGAYLRNEIFNSRAELDAAWPAESYQVILDTAHDGWRTNNLALSDEAPQNPPHLANWAAAQSIETTESFVLAWDAWTGGSTNDFIQLTIESEDGGPGFSSPEFLQEGAWDGTVTSVTLPVGALQPDQNYHGWLIFGRKTSLNTTSYPGVPGLAASYKFTGFKARTLPAAPNGRLQFTAASYTVTEDGVQATFTVTRTGGSQGAVSVQFSAADQTTTAGADYVATSEALTFAAGQTNASISLALFDDFIIEGPETFRVTLSAPTGGAILGTASNAVVTIQDNEISTAGVFKFAVAGYAVSEGSPSVLVTVLRTGGSNGVATVEYAATAGSAVSPQDYVDTHGTLSFAPGAQTRTITVPIINDTLVETDETFTLNLLNPTGGAALGNRTQTVVTIQDNDVAGALEFKLPTFKASETSGGAVVTVIRTGGAASGVSVDYAVLNGTALSGVDYAPTQGTLTFGAGQMSNTFQVPIINAPTATGTRKAALTLANPSGGAILGLLNAATLKITDDEIGFQFATSAITVWESNSVASITVKRTGPATAAVGVLFFTTNGTAVPHMDYTPAAGLLEFASGVVSRTILVPILNDTLVDGNASLDVILRNPRNGAILGPIANTVITILDDDIGGVISFQKTVVTVSETNAMVAIPVVRSNGWAGGVTVAFATGTNGTALPGVHFVPTNGTLTFTSDLWKTKLKIPLLDNTLVDGSRTVELLLSNPAGGASLGSLATAWLVITNNDQGGLISFSAPNYKISEAKSNATITLVRSGGLASAVTVDFAASAGTAVGGWNFIATNGTLSFSAGQTSAMFAVSILNNFVAEGDRSVLLSLSNPAGGATVGAVTNAVLKIRDDDVALQFATNTYSVSESAGRVVATIIRTGDTNAAVSVTCTTTNGTAIPGTDYKAKSSIVAFPPGVVTAKFSFPILNDSLSDGSKTVNLELSDQTPGAFLGHNWTAEVILEDDEAGP